MILLDQPYSTFTSCSNKSRIMTIDKQIFEYKTQIFRVLIREVRKKSAQFFKKKRLCIRCCWVQICFYEIIDMRYLLKLIIIIEFLALFYFRKTLTLDPPPLIWLSGKVGLNGWGGVGFTPRLSHIQDVLNSTPAVLFSVEHIRVRV